MKQRPNLGALAKTAGSARTQTIAPAKTKDKETKKKTQPSRRGTATIALHYPKNVRQQLKLLALKQETTTLNLGAEALNDLFAKYGMPEIVPVKNPEANEA